MTRLYRSTDRLYRWGAPIKKLAQNASFYSCKMSAPSKSGIKQEIGLGVLAFIRVKIDSRTEAEAEAFAGAVMKLDCVVACYSIAGDVDFLLRVVSQDFDTYSDFAMSVVRRLPGIKEMQTTFVLKEIKPFSGLPLPAEGACRER